jgi:hypothetical protein
MRPVLTPGEWAECERMATPGIEHAEVLRMSIALANGQLPVGDPLKFTREDAAAVGHAAAFYDSHGMTAPAAQLRALAERIESIQPPVTEH